MAFKVLRNDITQVEADLIVNPANPVPEIGGGSEFSIYEKAGKERLLAERMEIGEIAPGDVALTSAFNLKAKYIIHAVSPAWRDGGEDELKLLRSCYKKALDMAVEKNCRSIAFPLLGTGNNRFPKEKALLVAMSVIQNFLSTHDLKVMLVIFGQRTYELSSQFFEDITVFVNENYERRVLQKEYSAQHLSRTLPKSIFLDELDSGTLFRILDSWGKDFKEHLAKYVERSGMSNKEIYEAANVSKKVFYGIEMYNTSKKNRPAKNTLLALIVALKLSMSEALELLARAEYMLSNASQFDLIVGEFIRKKHYDVYDINIALYDKDENSELLGQK
ncbi:MAG: macro domain-containing protein [Selenomonadaceae bacterium]|nr:macro domain-containing protein [Selenomonadaceae bacterium]